MNSPYLINSYVSPKSGLKGLPVLSHWEATAETAKAATDYKQFKDGLQQLQPRQQMSKLPTGHKSQALSQRHFHSADFSGFHSQWLFTFI